MVDLSTSFRILSVECKHARFRKYVGDRNFSAERHFHSFNSCPDFSVSSKWTWFFRVNMDRKIISMPKIWVVPQYFGDHPDSARTWNNNLGSFLAVNKTKINFRLNSRTAIDSDRFLDRNFFLISFPKRFKLHSRPIVLFEPNFYF